MRRRKAKPISAKLRIAAGLAMLFWGFVDGASAAGPSDVECCVSIGAGMSLGAPLPRTRDKLRAGQPVTIVALGSSSTAGLGGMGTDYPAVLKDELAPLHPSVRIAVINSGRAFQPVPGDLARLDADALRYKPDLVVWQIGTNDVLWQSGASSAAAVLLDGVRRLKQANTDIILMDLQDAPMIRMKASYVAMQRLIADVAREQGIGLFRVFY
jgi:lysophospholipase L1-like esterase